MFSDISHIWSDQCIVYQAPGKELRGLVMFILGCNIAFEYLYVLGEYKRLIQKQSVSADKNRDMYVYDVVLFNTNFSRSINQFKNSSAGAGALIK